METDVGWGMETGVGWGMEKEGGYIGTDVGGEIGDIRAPSGDLNWVGCGWKFVGKLIDAGIIGTEGDGGLGIVPSEETGEREQDTDDGR
jgi:hypothetical protein